MVRINTRAEILRVAAEQFIRSGYKGASLQEIADAVGCSKATLLYHFAGKDAILHELIAPGARALADLVARLDALDDDVVQAAAIDGFVDLVLRYRREISLIYDVIPQFRQAPAFAAVRPQTERLLTAIAGRTTETSRVIAARVLLGGIVAVAIDEEYEPAQLRPAFTAVARRALLEE